MKISKVENLENQFFRKELIERGRAGDKVAATEPTQFFRKELTEKGGCKNDDLDDLDNENIQLDINKPNIDAVEKKKRIYKKKVIEPSTEVTNDVKIRNLNEPTVLLKKELTEKRGCAEDKVPAVKTKRILSEAHILNWSKCLEAREANRLKRKAEEQQQEEERKKSLENKIIIRASRIHKAQ